MKNEFSRIYKFRSITGGFVDSSYTIFKITLKNSVIATEKISGHDPLGDEVFTALVDFFYALTRPEDESEEELHIGEFKRTDRYRFVCQHNMSATKYFIETVHNDVDFENCLPRRKLLMWISCFGKVPVMKGYIFDILDFLVACGKFSIVEYDGYDTYDINSAFQEINTENYTVLVPRNILKEEGWLDPNNEDDRYTRPTIVVL